MCVCLCVRSQHKNSFSFHLEFEFEFQFEGSFDTSYQFFHATMNRFKKWTVKLNILWVGMTNTMNDFQQKRREKRRKKQHYFWFYSGITNSIRGIQRKWNLFYTAKVFCIKRFDSLLNALLVPVDNICCWNEIFKHPIEWGRIWNLQTIDTN